MIKIYYEKEFLKQFKRLPKDIKLKLLDLLPIVKENPFNPTLRTKPLQGKLRTFYSFRITREYRVMFRVPSFGEIDFLEVRHRKDIYK